MNAPWRKLTITILLAAALGAAASTVWAGGGHHPPHPGYYGHSSFSLGLGWAYPPPYWRPYPPLVGYYPGYAPAYGPAYGPGYLNIGYGFGGHHSSYGLSFSIPLYFGPRYAPQPAAAPVPAASTAYRKVDASCLQVREYQTEIVVGGNTVPAYGSACLQADGSWKTVNGPFPAD